MTYSLRVTACNKLAASFLGSEPGQIAGRPLDECGKPFVLLAETLRDALRLGGPASREAAFPVSAATAFRVLAAPIAADPDRFSSILVILNIGADSRRTRSAAKAGCDCHLVKPVEPDGLLRVLAGMPEAPS